MAAGSDDIDGLPRGLPRKFLRPCLLLLIAEQPSHGYDLLERLGEIGYQRAEPGGLYRTLRLMEQEGLIQSDWGTSQVGPRRRTYWLSADGLDWLHAWAGSMRYTQRVLDGFLSRYETVAETGAPERE
ncbi:helix-turn-helix transcriptional regulator [Pseudonocardia nigra]|uniref:helix-turn-helix transcriptional regulator n=1 Tax=Pseudonocardia nigra TaxID=1921578 RepID=UPI001C5FC78A|nr:helix-turn-helix transcriptional regulator [Pseudonocardia nigra]